MGLIDNLTKCVYFITVKATRKASKLAEIYNKVVLRLQRVPDTIVSDRDPLFAGEY